MFHYLLPWDMIVSVWMQEMQRPWLIKRMLVITYMGYPLTFIILTALVSTYLLGVKGGRLEAIFLNASLFSAWAVMEYLKHWFGRSRPAGEALTAASGYSFPSGHAMLAMVFYGFLAYLLISHAKNKLEWYGVAVLCLMILLIGFSRVYLNVHYASDVLAGFLFGFICLAVNIKGLRITQQRLRS